MQKLEQMISVYHTAFIIFLVLTIVFLLISILLFFKLNIRDIYDMRTGRGARRKIQEMEEINARTGKLRTEVADALSHTEPEVQPLPQTKSEPLFETKHKVEYQEDSSITMEISHTEQEADAGDSETTLLNDETETTLLSEQKEGDRELPGTFKIEKEVLWIHTDEVL